MTRFLRSISRAQHVRLKLRLLLVFCHWNEVAKVESDWSGNYYRDWLSASFQKSMPKNSSYVQVACGQGMALQRQKYSILQDVCFTQNLGKNAQKLCCVIVCGATNLLISLTKWDIIGARRDLDRHKREEKSHQSLRWKFCGGSLKASWKPFSPTHHLPIPT